MKHTFYAIVGMLAFSTPLAAQETLGDAVAGATQFSRLCVACHVIADDTGEVIAGSRAGIGPNLFGISGAMPGTQEDYDDYSEALIAYGETGVTWAEDNTVAFIQDPNGHLREALEDPRARSKMSYRLRSAENARDIYAYLATFSVADDAQGTTDPDAEETTRTPSETSADE